MNSELETLERPPIVGTVINASYPRSGHRFLRNVLSDYFDNNFVFYESHTKKLISGDPNKRTTEFVNYVKTHDFDLQGRTILEELFPKDRRYLVQIRHPLESIVSYYEFRLRHNTLLSDTRDTWTQFLNDKLNFWKRFFKVWLFQENRDSLVVTYDDLCTNTYDTAVKVIEFITCSSQLNADRLSQVTANQDFLQYRGDVTSQKEELRRLQSFKYFDQNYFSRIETDLYEEFLLPVGIQPVVCGGNG